MKHHISQKIIIKAQNKTPLDLKKTTHFTHWSHKVTIQWMYNCIPTPLFTATCLSAISWSYKDTRLSGLLLNISSYKNYTCEKQKQAKNKIGKENKILRKKKVKRHQQFLLLSKQKLLLMYGNGEGRGVFLWKPPRTIEVFLCVLGLLAVSSRFNASPVDIHY